MARNPEGSARIALWVLEARVVRGRDAKRTVSVHGAHLSIGSAEGNHLRLRDASVAPHHCEIEALGDRIIVRDLGSEAGTSVGGAKITEAPIEPGHRITLGKCSITVTATRRWHYAKPSAEPRFGAVVGQSIVMRELFDLCAEVAPTELAVLLSGEPGTGKEQLARAIHRASERSSGPFIAIDCGADGAIDELLNNERPGALELAAGGTIFLDEAGELPLRAQSALAHALMHRSVTRGSQERSIDVRVVAASHRALDALVELGQLREDLFRRIGAVRLQVPALRERLEDVPLLASHMLSAEAVRYGQPAVFDAAALARLSAHAWPGNVRELRNVVRRAYAASTSDAISAKEISAALGEQPPRSSFGSILAMSYERSREHVLRRFEKEYVEHAIERAGGDLVKAAARAKVHRKSFERLVRRSRGSD